jgi:hypothetical protein
MRGAAVRVAGAQDGWVRDQSSDAAIFSGGAVGRERFAIFRNQPAQQAVRGFSHVLRPQVATGAPGALDRGVAEKCAMLPRLFLVLYHRLHHLQGRLLLA